MIAHVNATLSLGSPEKDRKGNKMKVVENLSAQSSRDLKCETRWN